MGVPGFSIATHFFSPTQTTCLTEENQSVLQLKRKKKEERKHQPGKMCVRYTLLIANSLLALLGLLLLAGGVWRIVDDQSLRDVANELRDTAEWDNVAKEVTGLDDAAKEAAGHKYFNYALLGMEWNHPPRRSLWILRSQEGESVPPLPLHHLRLHHPPAPDCCHRLHQCRRRKHQFHQGLHQLGD